MNIKRKLIAAATLLTVAASCVTSVFTGITPSAAADDTNDDWLHAVGSRLYDKDGNQVWLTGANWFGLNCGEACPHYLWSVDVDDALSTIADHGINIIRFPVSSELLISWMNGKPNAVSSIQANIDPSYTINADFCNADGSVKNSMEIFDVIMNKCKKYGLKAFIDIHSPHTDNSGHNYPLWYGKETTDGTMVTTDLWIDSLVWLADKYKNDDTLLAYDLKNEPHGKGQEGSVAAKWDGSTDENNWAYAATKCANAILDVNPNALILVEGVEQSVRNDSFVWGQPDSKTNPPYYPAWWGGNLRGVKDYPINLGSESRNSQIVYSPHDYGPAVYEQTWFQGDFTTESLLKDYWYDTWAYINDQDIAPLLMGEWGGFMDAGRNQKWLELLRDYMIDNHINHTFWCLNTNSGDTGGLWTSFAFSPQTGSTIEWDEEKYALLEKALWQTNESGKFIGLDHKNPLGINNTGITVSDYYANYDKTEGSNLDADGSVEPAKTTASTAATTSETTTTTVVTTKVTSATTKKPTGETIDPSDLMYGDVDLDDVIGATDIVMINKYILSTTEYPLESEKSIKQANCNCDYNEDGSDRIDLTDSSMIINVVLGITDKSSLGPQA